MDILCIAINYNIVNMLLYVIDYLDYMIIFIVTGKNPRKWYPPDGGWVLHVISTASEWVVAICFCFYILSFTPEFREVTFDHPKVG